MLEFGAASNKQRAFVKGLINAYLTLKQLQSHYDIISSSDTFIIMSNYKDPPSPQERNTLNDFLRYQMKGVITVWRRDPFMSWNHKLYQPNMIYVTHINPAMINHFQQTTCRPAKRQQNQENILPAVSPPR